MLYATTRNKNDVHTAHKVIHFDCARDGGLFLPLSIPAYDNAQILALKDNTPAQNIAAILNGFFSCGLTALDIEFAIGRNPIQVCPIGNRTLAAEIWHNSHWQFDFFVQTLSDRMRREGTGEQPTNWLRIAVRIAVLFAIYGMTQQCAEAAPVDMAVASGDFSTPIACWYARKMGLPIENIICGCNNNGSVWDLLHRGQLNTAAVAVKTTTPDADFVVPRDLERLIHGTLGQDEAVRFVDSCRAGSMYTVAEEAYDTLREGMFASVISDQRVCSVIMNQYRNSGYVLSPYAALAYGSLSDYRAKTGEGRTALLICERSAVRDDAYVASCMDISVPELEKILNLA